MNDQCFSVMGHPAVLSVLVPAYNEERTIGAVLRRLLALGDLLKEIIVVDDGSTDDTAGVVRSIAADTPLIRLYPLALNQGKTAAVRHALGHATGTILI